MKFLLSIFLSIIFFFANCQQAYNNKKLPPFKILLSNGSFFSPENIKKNRPVVLIYFAPDCEHCKKLLNSFFQKVGDFNNAEVIMITFKPLEEVTRFIYDYGMNRYANITVGTEGNSFFIRYFYKLSNTPFVALFDKKGNLISSYRQILSVDNLVSDFQKLNKSRDTTNK